ncbi:hypothetical protein CU097_008212 [Rhizopus azygosporus]|uniref:F-BAR domain-containing protein n=1 Tax=Rhizopus azygosporus TaxID=86630 RepID=A0A367JEU0_RHIAZ|nr:hypothetical protein CU097_008212 [Rhizopus azygosporus]
MTTDINSTHFSDNFWESLEKNGITILLERMRGAKQTCERLKNAYEARALLEEEYGKTLLQIAQKQKASSTENGKTKVALDTMQVEFQSIAESHIQLSCHLRDGITTPLAKLINKQKAVRKELQSSIQKLYNNRQLQVHFVRRAHKRHNQEIEKANILVEGKSTEEEKQAAFKTAQATVEKLKSVYDEGLNDLTKIVEEWNNEWKNTCDTFERLEQERIQFFKTNISNYTNLMVGCLENEIQAYERVNVKVEDVDVMQDLTDFVNENRSTHIVPSPMDYIKLHAYQEVNLGKEEETKSTFHNTIDHEEHSDTEDHELVKNVEEKKSEVQPVPDKIVVEHTTVTTTSIDSTVALVEQEPDTDSPKILMVGKMEVYGSDDSDDDEEYEYVTETESEEENEIKEEKKENVVSQEKEDTMYSKPLSQSTEKDQASPVVIKAKEEKNSEPIEVGQGNQSTSDEKISKLAATYRKQAADAKLKRDESFSSILLKKGLNTTRRRVSFLNDERPSTEQQEDNKPLYKTSSIDAVKRTISSDSTETQDTTGIEQDAAARELDNMLRELDTTHRNHYRQPNIRPTASASSPSLLQDRWRGSYFDSQSSRRMSTADNSVGNISQRISPSRNSNNTSYSSSTMSSNNMGDLYDPFNSLSSSSKSGANGLNDVMPTKSMSTSNTPTAQMIHERMLRNGNKLGHYRRRSVNNADTISSGSSASLASVRSREGFVQNFYNLKKNNNGMSTIPPENREQFIDFAIALYDYEGADEGEISFKQGDLLGIISKGDDEQGWWEASLLDKVSAKIIQTGLIPSNFIETAFRS